MRWVLVYGIGFISSLFIWPAIFRTETARAILSKHVKHDSQVTWYSATVFLSIIWPLALAAIILKLLRAGLVIEDVEGTTSEQRARRAKRWSDGWAWYCGAFALVTVFSVVAGDEGAQRDMLLVGWSTFAGWAVSRWTRPGDPPGDPK